MKDPRGFALISAALLVSSLLSPPVAKAQELPSPGKVIHAGCRRLDATHARLCRKAAAEALREGLGLSRAISRGCRLAGEVQGIAQAYSRQAIADSTDCMKVALDFSNAPALHRILDRCEQQAAVIDDLLLRAVTRFGCYDASLVAPSDG